MRLRQIALVARELAGAEADIRAILGLDWAYADPAVGKYGLSNAVFPVGSTFLEVVSPIRDGTTAGRLLEKRDGDGGYMVILQVDDITHARARVTAAGARIVEQANFDGVAMSHVHPRDVGGAILSLDWMSPKERWEWGGKGWEGHVKTDVATAITGAELQGEDPAAMAARWAEVLGRTAVAGGGADSSLWRVVLDASEIRFSAIRDGRGEGLAAFDVTVRSPDAVRRAAAARGAVDGQGAVLLCGTRVNLLQA